MNELTPEEIKNCEARMDAMGFEKAPSSDTSKPVVSAEELAKQFHETYERLASDYNYKTRQASAVPWKDVPEDNKKLMIAVCKEILSTVEKTNSA